MAIPAGIRRRMFARLLLLQATWNFERMQGLGFAYALEPWLERLYPQGTPRASALARHTEFFNTQPYVASLIAGVVCAIEEDAAGLPADRRQAAYERLGLVKKAAAAALAGLGDSFFWGTLRPAAAAAGLGAGMLSLEAGALSAGFWTATVYLLAYNVPALWLRWRGLALGYEWREQLPARLKAYEIQAWIRRLRLAGWLAAAGLVALALLGAESSQRVVGALSLAVFWVSYLLLLDRASALRLYAAACAIGFLTAAAGWL